MKLRSFVLLIGLCSGALATAQSYAQDNSGVTVQDNLYPLVQDKPYSLLENLFPLVKVAPTVQESPLRDVDQYEDAVHQLEASRGFYDPALEQELLGLGLAYRASGRHRDAVEAFGRSLHVTRVNEGLYTLSQLPVLDLIIGENTTREDWKNLDQNYQYLFWLYRRNFGDNDARLLPAINRAARWHLRAYNGSLDKHRFAHLVEADKLLDQAVDIIQSQYGPHDSRLIDPLDRLALTNYDMALYAATVEDVREIRAAFLTAGMDGVERWYAEQQVRQTLAQESYRRGKQVLSRVVDIYAHAPEFSIDSRASALTHLGDWYQVFGMRYHAADKYKEAYTLLQKGGTPPERIEHLFGRPRLLPDLNASVADQAESEPESAGVAHAGEAQQVAARTDDPTTHAMAFDGAAAPVSPGVTASCDVSAAGKASNIKIVDGAGATDGWSIGSLLKRIAAARFRPRLDNGKPVDTKDVKLRLLLDDSTAEGKP